MPGRVTEAPLSWKEAGSQANDRKIWRIVPASSWWTIQSVWDFFSIIEQLEVWALDKTS